jgi:hypothetical protein
MEWAIKPPTAITRSTLILLKYLVSLPTMRGALNP